MKSVSLTPAELDAVCHWWLTGKVKAAAVALGLSEQTVKNQLATARRRCRVKTNVHLVQANWRAMAEHMRQRGMGDYYRRLRYRFDAEYAERARNQSRDAMRRLRTKRQGASQNVVLGKHVADSEGTTATSGAYAATHHNIYSGKYADQQVGTNHAPAERGREAHNPTIAASAPSPFAESVTPRPSRMRPDDQVTATAHRQRKYRQNPENRLKGNIRNRIHRALKVGQLVRQPCYVCGAEKVEAHHHRGYDLDHALDVLWLCKAHHEVLHPHRARPKKGEAAA